MYNVSMFRNEVQVSVCVPVYNSEKYLFRCLKSIATQSLEKKEIVIVNDASSGMDSEGKDFFSIIKKFRKNFKLDINVIVHKKNLGLLEARRSAVYAAKGKYICIVDSDDFLEPDALKNMYDAAEKNKADIIQGRVNVNYSQNAEIRSEEQKEKLLKKMHAANLVYSGELVTNDILEGFILKKNHCGFLWGKLYLKEVYLEALNHIPAMSCTMAEDLLQYFFIAYEAKKYVGIENIVYNYSLETGISSGKKKTDLCEWEKMCTIASVFSFLLNEMINEHPDLYKKEICYEIKKDCRFKLKNNLKQLEVSVPEEIKEDAYKMLCEYWGEDFVKQIETEQRTEAFSGAVGESVRTERE